MRPLHRTGGEGPVRHRRRVRRGDEFEGKSAALTLSKEVSDQVLTDAVTQAGYEVVSVQ